MIRSLADPISMAPEADTRASTWNSAPLMPSRLEIAVGHQGGEQHGHGDQHVDQHAEAVHHDGMGDVGVGAVGLHVGPLPDGDPEGAAGDDDGAEGGDRTRSGRLTSEATASRSTAPPIMMIGGRMLR